MLLPLKGIITSKPRRDGNFIIYFQYCYSANKRVLLSTEIAIPRTFWNAKRQSISKLLPTEFGDFQALNNELLRIRRVIEEIIAHGVNHNVLNLGEYIKSIFRPDFDTSKLSTIPEKQIRRSEPELIGEIDNYVKDKGASIAPGTLATYRVMKERLVAFEQYRKRKLSFRELDYSFYTELIEFLAYRYTLRRKKQVEYGLKTSTIGKTINLFRNFVSDRVRRKIVVPIDLTDFKAIDAESDAIYLSYEEIGKMYSLNLKNDPTLELYRDVFVLGCLTGLRFSDYSSLKGTDMRDGLLYKKTSKTDNWVVIPLRKEAELIFKKYYLTGKFKISNPVFNRYIKEIAQLAGINESITFSHKKGNKTVVQTKPKSQWVTSHTCRRSFATNEYLAGTDINLIMRITGHRTHKDFFKYIRVGQLEAAQKIKEIWSARNNMAAFNPENAK